MSNRYNRRGGATEYGHGTDALVSMGAPGTSGDVKTLLGSPGTSSDALQQGYALHLASLKNTGGADLDCWLGGFFPTSEWEAGQWTDATTTYTVDADAEVGPGTMALQTVSTNNNGHVVLAKRKFNAVVYAMNTAEGNNAVVDEWAYWSGSAWVTFTPVSVPTDAFASTNEELVVIPSTSGMGLTTTSSFTNAPADHYALRYRATTAPDTTAALASQLWVGAARWAVPQVPAGGTVRWEDPDGYTFASADEQPWVLTDTATANIESYITASRVDCGNVVGV